MVKIFGTFGPNCADQETLERMIEEGVTGMRVNLSHTTLQGCRDRVENYRAACEAKGVVPEILVDLRGPQMRTGWMSQSVSTEEGDTVLLRAKRGKNQEYPIVNVAPVFLEALEVGDRILIRDGEMELEVIEELPLMELPLPETPQPETAQPETPPVPEEEQGEELEEAPEEGQEEGEAAEPCEAQEPEEAPEEIPLGKRKRFLAKVLRSGTIRSQQTVKIEGKEVYGDVLTVGDMETLDLAREYGVTSVMLPFVRSGEDVRFVKDTLAEKGLSLRVYTKIETLMGLGNLDSIIAEADEVVIARGDLGNAMPLWELARVQKEISDRCAAAGRDFMVVTQMLQSMMRKRYPTRAEVSDVFHAVTDGASSVMVTGETSVGDYPVEVIRYLAKTVREAERYLGRLE